VHLALVSIAMLVNRSVKELLTPCQITSLS
jgi:hypothetical protein